MKPVALDSDVLAGLLDPRDWVTSRLVMGTLPACVEAGHLLVVPVSMLSELLDGPLRSSPDAIHKAGQLIDDCVLEPYSEERVLAEAATRYQDKHPGMARTTALAFALADLLDARCLLTMEPRWTQVSPRAYVLLFEYMIPPSS